jgi:uncharacterized repeat protein (TIGR02543 family)
MKGICGKKTGSALFVLAFVILLTGCPSDVLDSAPSAAPAASVTTGVHAGTEGGPGQSQKAVVFYLTSFHPADAIWKVYTVETGGVARSDVSASYDRAAKKLTLTALENDVPVQGVYWVSVTERGRDESLRLKLTVKFLYPLAITYDANGGMFPNGAVRDSVEWANSSVAMPSPSPGDPSRDGFVFAGWNGKSDGTGEAFPWETGFAGDAYVYAKWIAAGTPFTVTFLANGGSFSGGAPSLEKTGTFTTGGSKLGAGNMPSAPSAPNSKYTFGGWNSRADGLGTVFNGDTLITGPAVTVYAKWNWDKNSSSLQLHHNFESVSGTTVTPAKFPSGGGPYTAAMAGTGGVTGSKTIGTSTFYYYKTGAKGAMNNTATSYLNLGTGAGSVLHNASAGYTMAAYVRIDGDWSGAGNFIWAFAETSNVTQTSGRGLWCSAPGSSHATTTGGWQSSAAQSISSAGAITQGTWRHVAYTQEGKTGTGNAKLYVDGVLKASGPITALPSDFNALEHNALGGPCFLTDNNLSQTMFADFRIYNEALEELQIRELAADLKALNSAAW